MSKDEPAVSGMKESIGPHFVHMLVDAAGNGELVSKIPGAGERRHASRYIASVRRHLDDVQALSSADQESLVKSLALYEQSVGGVGSPTSLYYVLPILSDPQGKLFDWVLRNTDSYSYYSFGAKSYDEFLAIRQAQDKEKADKATKELARLEADAVRRRERATANLPNAIRRGDAKAVEVLIRSGARLDRESCGGLSPLAYAESLGKLRVAELIRGLS